MDILTKLVTSQPHLADIIKSKQLLDLKGCFQIQGMASGASGGVLRPKLYSNNYHSLEHASNVKYFSIGREAVLKNELNNLSTKMASYLNVPVKDVKDTLLTSSKKSNLDALIDLYLADKSLDNTQLLHEFVDLENPRTHEIADFSLASEQHGAIPAKGREYDHDIYLSKFIVDIGHKKEPADLKNDSTLTDQERIEKTIQYNSKPYNAIVMNASHYVDLFGEKYEKGMLTEKYSEAGLKKQVLETTSQDSNVGQGDPKSHIFFLIEKELGGREQVSSAELINISKKIAPLVLPKDYNSSSVVDLNLGADNLDVD